MFPVMYVQPKCPIRDAPVQLGQDNDISEVNFFFCFNSNIYLNLFTTKKLPKVFPCIYNTVAK